MAETPSASAGAPYTPPYAGSRGSDAKGRNSIAPYRGAGSKPLPGPPTAPEKPPSVPPPPPESGEPSLLAFFPAPLARKLLGRVLAGQPLGEGALRALRRIWEAEGRPGKDFEAWAASLERNLEAEMGA